MPASPSAESIRNLAFFSGLPDTLLWHLGKAAEHRTLAAGDVLFRTGEPRTLFAIVLSGTISIDQEAAGKNVHITTLTAGEVVGEGILLEESARHGTIGRATEPTELVCFRREPLLKLFKDQPALYGALLSRAGKILNARIRSANVALAGAQGSDTDARQHVLRWIDEIVTLAPVMGYEKAVAAVRETVTKGGQPSGAGAGR